MVAVGFGTVIWMSVVLVVLARAPELWWEVVSAAAAVPVVVVWVQGAMP